MTSITPDIIDAQRVRRIDRALERRAHREEAAKRARRLASNGPVTSCRPCPHGPYPKPQPTVIAPEGFWSGDHQPDAPRRR